MRPFALCLLLAFASPASAETFDLADRAVTIELPAGYCPLDRDHPMDREILAVTEDINTSARYLVHGAPCRNLEDWHERRAVALVRYLNAVTPLFEGEAMSVGDMTRRQFFREMRKTLPDMDLDEIRAAINDLYNDSTDLSVEGIQLFGVIAEDENAIYVALAAEISDGVGETVGATVWAATLLDSVIIFVYLSGEMTPDAHETMAAELAPYMADLVRSNP